ncbi:RNase adapter RapZ [Streptomyces sp. NPDC048272]|uniref:RapZ C-terminal domain-containing protein n=1 Tax=Streptomyces sp. NPDC048272 TaxID=3154616 RepID=UPI003440B45F
MALNYLGRCMSNMTKTMKITSFGYERAGGKDGGGIVLAVPEADIVLDVRRILPSSDDPALRGLTGLDEAVYEQVLASSVARSVAVQIAVGAHMLLDDTDVPRLTIAVGCSGGRRRAVVIARHIGTRLAELNAGAAYELAVEHRDLATGSSKEE